MKTIILKKNYLKLAAFSIVFVFTFILRAHNYQLTPGALHLDEMLYAWSGIYLIETGVPVSWSTLDYPKRAEVYKGRISYKGGSPETSVTLFRPWLDEPPLFSLIVGYFAHINHVPRTDFIPSSYIRIPSIFFATVVSILIFFIAKMVSNFWTGLLAMIIYGTVPIMVISSRVALPENLIALIFVIIAYLLLKFYQSPSFIDILFIPFLIGIAGLSKPTGFLLLFLPIYIIFKKLIETGKIKTAFKYSLYLITLTLPFAGLFILYGLHFDAEIFWRITSIQSFRPIGLKSLGWFFISPSYGTSILTDCWYIFCLLSAFYFLFSPKEGLKKMISLFFIYWVGVVMLTGGEGDLLAWYRFPTFPFLAILGAWGLQVLIKKADLFTTFVATGLLLGGRSLLVNAFRPNLTPIEVRLTMIFFLLPSIINSIFEKNWLYKLNKAIVILIICVGIYLNVVYVYNQFELSCESISCPIVPSTSISTLHLPFIWKFIILGPPKYQ